jgi:hypothetical protein
MKCEELTLLFLKFITFITIPREAIGCAQFGQWPRVTMSNFISRGSGV